MPERLNAFWLCLFFLQTQSMDTDDYDDKITQNTDAQSGVSITNLSK